MIGIGTLRHFLGIVQVVVSILEVVMQVIILLNWEIIILAVELLKILVRHGVWEHRMWMIIGCALLCSSKSSHRTRTPRPFVCTCYLSEMCHFACLWSHLVFQSSNVYDFIDFNVRVCITFWYCILNCIQRLRIIFRNSLVSLNYSWKRSCLIIIQRVLYY